MNRAKIKQMLADKGHVHITYGYRGVVQKMMRCEDCDCFFEFYNETMFGDNYTIRTYRGSPHGAAYRAERTYDYILSCTEGQIAEIIE